jgi:hypothetical protein
LSFILILYTNFPINPSSEAYPDDEEEEKITRG